MELHTPFYDLTRQGKLAFPYCDNCGLFHWYPRMRCPHCRAEWVWREVSGEGSVFTWTTVEHGFSPELATKVPFIVGLIEFEDAPGVRLVSNVIGVAEEEMSIGMKVSLSSERLEYGDKCLPVFGPTGAAASR